MEITVVSTDRQLTNKKLVAATEKIRKAANAVMSNYARIGETLSAIREQKLYKEDFSNFREYCLEMFNMSQETANRIIRVTTNLLLPDTENKRFDGFADTALAALTSVGDYETVVEFCDAHNIDETTSVREISATIKAATSETSDNSDTTEQNSATDEEQTDNKSTLTEIDFEENWVQTYGETLSALDMRAVIEFMLDYLYGIRNKKYTIADVINAAIKYINTESEEK